MLAVVEGRVGGNDEGLEPHLWVVLDHGEMDGKVLAGTGSSSLAGANGGGGPPAAMGGGEGVHELHSAMGNVAAGFIWVMRVWMGLATMSLSSPAWVDGGGVVLGRERLLCWARELHCDEGKVAVWLIWEEGCRRGVLHGAGAADGNGGGAKPRRRCSGEGRDQWPGW